MSPLKIDTIVIGAGLIGLACAEAIARQGRSVAILEQHPSAGTETSKRNSGVIHAGLYYPAGSRKAALCVRGRVRLYEWCTAYDVSFVRCGKWIVATTAKEAERLVAFERSARANDVGNLQLVPGATVRSEDPALACVLGLWSPETGIVDLPALITSVRVAAESVGVQFEWSTRVVGLRSGRDGWEVEALSSSNERRTFRSATVINAAGLYADRVAELAGLEVDALGFRQRFIKGSYFELSSDAPRPEARLVYPVASKGPGLGIHFTRGIRGTSLVGPDAREIEALDYEVRASDRDHFAAAVSAYLPGVKASNLKPAFAGVRPSRLVPPGTYSDFVIHQHMGIVHLIGIESPGLTAAFAIADEVTALLSA